MNHFHLLSICAEFTYHELTYPFVRVGSLVFLDVFLVDGFGFVFGYVYCA